MLFLAREISILNKYVFRIWRGRIVITVTSYCNEKAVACCVCVLYVCVDLMKMSKIKVLPYAIVIHNIYVLDLRTQN